MWSTTAKSSARNAPGNITAKALFLKATLVVLSVVALPERWPMAWWAERVPATEQETLVGVTAELVRVWLAIRLRKAVTGESQSLVCRVAP